MQVTAIFGTDGCLTRPASVCKKRLPNAIVALASQ
jgi:hypothetical protein